MYLKYFADGAATLDKARPLLNVVQTGSPDAACMPVRIPVMPRAASQVYAGR
jgi:hypothetical protein